MDEKYCSFLFFISLTSLTISLSRKVAADAFISLVSAFSPVMNSIRARVCKICAVMYAEPFIPFHQLHEPSAFCSFDSLSTAEDIRAFMVLSSKKSPSERFMSSSLSAAVIQGVSLSNRSFNSAFRLRLL